jgi:hypothetical protein
MSKRRNSSVNTPNLRYFYVSTGQIRAMAMLKMLSGDVERALEREAFVRAIEVHLALRSNA